MSTATYQHPNNHVNHDVLHLDDLPVSDFVRVYDHEEIEATLASIPAAFRRDCLDEYERLYSEYQRDNQVSVSSARQSAEGYLADLRCYVRNKPFLNQSDTGLRAKAKRYARYVAHLIGKDQVAKGCYFVEKIGVDVPFTDWMRLSEDWKAAHDAVASALVRGDNPESYQLDIERLQSQWLSIKARLVDEDWWIARLVKKNDREFEKFAIHWGRVREGKQVYVSNETLEKITSRRHRSLEVMKGLLAVSDEGDEIEMLDILKGSIANPSVRMAELMNRIYGFEAYAKEKGHIAEFYTFTAPSQYHANSSKYSGKTPREVQQAYFSPMWARIRAKLHKEACTIYGFRIAESHKDGCTHWHVLLFMPRDQVVEVSNILVDYAFRESGTEKGAYLSRFDWEEIDPNQGSAIGYVIKYISKNMSGFDFNSFDHELDQDMNTDQGKLPLATKSVFKKGQGNRPNKDELTQRVGAWASVWGVRQFQQIGGSSVSVWRELRRLGDAVQDDPLIEAARQAANQGDWKAYLEVQDGINLPLKAQPIQLYRYPDFDPSTGEMQMNKYGEVVDSIQGLQTQTSTVITRLKRWTIQKKASDENAEKHQIAPDANALPLETPEAAIQRILTPECDVYTNSDDPIDLTHMQDYWQQGGDQYLPPVSGDFQLIQAATALAFDLPWSTVNNCRHLDISNPKNDLEFINAIKKAYQDHVNSGKKVAISQFDFVRTLLKIM